MDLIIIAIFILGILCFFSLCQSAKAWEWFRDDKNKKLFRKHFGSENITTFINDVGNVTLLLSVRGETKELNLGYKDALDLYKETAQGSIRKYLHKKGCI